MNFLKLIKDDLIKNYKIFSFFLIFFTLIFYIVAYQNKESGFSYYSNILIKFPEAKVKWVEFDKNKYSADLFFISANANANFEFRFGKICNLKNLKLISNFKKKIEGFSFLEFEIFHKEKATKDCLNKIYNEIILEHFNEYLHELALVNKSYLNLLETEVRSVNDKILENLNQYLTYQSIEGMEYEVQKKLLLNYLNLNNENEKIGFMIKVSSLKSSYNEPRIFKKNLNSIYRERSINHIKIIFSSLIFTSILTLLVGSLFKKIRQKI